MENKPIRLYKIFSKSQVGFSELENLIHQILYFNISVWHRYISSTPNFVTHILQTIKKTLWKRAKVQWWLRKKKENDPILVLLYYFHQLNVTFPQNVLGTLFQADKCHKILRNWIWGIEKLRYGNNALQNSKQTWLCLTSISVSAGLTEEI